MEVEVPEGYVRIRADGATAWVRADLADVPLTRWWGDASPLPGARGRGDGVAVVDIERPRLRAVVRVYRRGGALRHVLPDRFLDAGRAFRELELTVALQRAGVPVASPLASIARGGLLAELRFATELLDGARTLLAFCAQQQLSRSRAAIARAGAVVAAAFAAGLDHPDLHPDNLLVAIDGDGEPRVHMIDLDRARLRTALDTASRDRMLVRFARYLVRHRDRVGGAVHRTDTLRFLRGTGLDRAGRRAALRRLAPAYARAIAPRRLTYR